MDKQTENCPFCKSKNTEQWTSTRSESVGWEDGLGSPGTISIRTHHAKCNDCKRQWTPSDN